MIYWLIAIAAIALIVFAIKLLRDFERKLRAERDAAASELARGELEADEKLLYVYRPGGQTIFGGAVMLLGMLLTAPLFASIALSLAMEDAVIVVAVMSVFGLIMMYTAFVMLRYRYKDHIFITNKRLAQRKTSLTIKQIKKDYPAENVRNVHIIDHRYYFMHSHYQVNIFIDTGKRKPYVLSVMVYRSGEVVNRFADAILSIANVGKVDTT